MINGLKEIKTFSEFYSMQKYTLNLSIVLKAKLV